MVCAWQQTGYWRDSETLWTHALDCTARNATAHYGLGTALSELDRDDDAIAELEEAVKIRPNYAEARFNLGSALEHRGQDRCGHRTVLSGHREPAGSGQSPLQPRRRCWPIAGRPTRPSPSFGSTLEYKPDYANAHYNLALCLDNQGKTAEAMAYWHEALRLEPNNVDTLDQVAWRLATCPDASIRDGQKAIELAERAVQLSKAMSPRPLSTLAAAYAEVGRFSEAVETAQRAIELAVQRGDTARPTISVRRSSSTEPIAHITSGPVSHDKRKERLGTGVRVRLGPWCCHVGSDARHAAGHAA